MKKRLFSTKCSFFSFQRTKINNNNEKAMSLQFFFYVFFPSNKNERRNEINGKSDLFTEEKKS